MRAPAFLCVAACALALAAAASNPFVAHPARLPFQLAAASLVDPDALLTLSLALTQANVSALRAAVQDVSSPSSPEYGNYWTVDQVAALLAPAAAVVDRLESFFVAHGAVAVHRTRSRDFLVVQLPVAAAAALFQTKFAVFEHRESGRRIVRATGHPVMPAEVAAAVDVITGLHDFFELPQEKARVRDDLRLAAVAPNCTRTNAPIVMRPRGSETELALTIGLVCSDGSLATDAVSPCALTPAGTIQSFTFTLTPADGSQPIDGSRDFTPSDCALRGAAVTCTFPVVVIPAFTRLNISVVQYYTLTTAPPSATGYYTSLFSPSPLLTPRSFYDTYGVPHGSRATHPNNSQAVTAFELQFVNIDQDLTMFDAYMGLALEPPVIWGDNDPTQPGGESTLDLQWISAIAPGAKTVFFSVTGPGPAIPPGQGAYILEWALQVSNLTDADAPKVTSISYGDTEIGFFNKFGDFSYVQRMEVELAKMAVRGLTVVAGSGDAGASNVGEAGNDVSPTDPTCTPFRAFYPSSSPYVLSLSSTFLTTAYLPVCEQKMGPVPVQCTQVGERSVSVRDGLYWTTGGGFANRSDNETPLWQQAQVDAFLTRAKAGGLLPPTDGGVWNARGRGYPDLSTLGHNLLFVFAGALGTVDGTSASGPVAAGLLTLVNDALLHQGLPTLGLVNPLLYSLQESTPTAFNDIVMGSNFDGDWQPPCAQYPAQCPYGFTTQPGWDPVSGLGSPNFPVIRDAAIARMRAQADRRARAAAAATPARA